MSDPPSSDERLFSGYAGRLLVAVSIGWGTVQGGRLVLSPLLPAIKADLALSNAEAGFGFTVMWGLYALLQYPSGRLSDRLSRTTLLMAGFLLAGVGFAVLSQAPGYPVYLLGVAVVGVGVGLYPTTARAMLSDLFEDRRGQAFGLHTASGDLGGVAAAGLGTVVLAVATWRAAFLPVVVLVGVVAVAVHWWSREPYTVEAVDLAIRPTLRRLLVQDRLRWLLIAYALYSISWQSTAAFLPTFLGTEKALSAVVANAGFAALFVVGAAVKPVAGWLADRLSRGVVATGALALAASSLGAVVVLPTPFPVIVGVVIFAAGLMAFPPVMQAYLMDAFPTETMDGYLGGMRTLYISVGALGPTIVGFVADAASYTTAFAGIVAALLVGSAITLLISRR